MPAEIWQAVRALQEKKYKRSKLNCGENVMKKLLNSAFSRAVFVGLFMVLQLAVIIGAILLFRDKATYIYFGFELVSVVAVLWIVNSPSNPAYKIAWIIPVLLLPVFGGLFWLVFGRDRLSRHERERMRGIESRYAQAMQAAPNEIGELDAENHEAALQAGYTLRMAGAPVYRRTSTEYLEIGETYFARMLEELEKAQKFIFLEYFIIEPGKMWDPILDLLERKVKQGVDVRVMYDDFGCLMTLPNNYFRTLQARGIKACIFNRFVPVLSSRFNNRDHRKICVIDGNVGITGGINLADEYINAYPKHGHWLDCGILLKGEAVWSLTVMFLSVWDFVCSQQEDFSLYRPDPDFCATVSDDGFVQPFTDTPMDNEPVGETVYMNIINRAKRYVYICTPYLIIDNEMTTALCMAAKSGVDVRIVTPHVPDKRFVHMTTRSYYPLLLAAGVRIYEYTPGFVHAKSFVCDDQYGVVGTINLDYRSLFLHYENAVWLYESSAVHEIRDRFLQTLTVCEEMNATKARATGFARLKRAVLRLFAPLM